MEESDVTEGDHLASMSVAQQVQVTEQEESTLTLLNKPIWQVLSLDWEKTAFIVVVVVAAMLRFWDMGSRALHHDESLHAVYGWYLTTGRGYVHDPLMHGPFQFHATALMYFLFGVSDYTARILPALIGTVTVGMPYFLRDRLGRWGALTASVLLAISPSLLYYNRFLREDTYVVLWHMVMLVGMWWFIQSGKRKDLLIGVAGLSLHFATKETAYLTVLIWGSFLFFSSLPEFFRRLVGGMDFRGASNKIGFLLTTGSLFLPLGSASAVILFKFLDFHPEGTDKLLVGSVVVLALGSLAAFVGKRWSWGMWLAAAGVFYAIFAVLFTTFFTNIPGLASGMWGGLEYWINQQDVQRGNQPWFYYILLIPIYEYLALAFAAVGAVYFGILSRFSGRFLIFSGLWLLESVALCLFAGESMPWLVAQVPMPLLMMALRFKDEFAGFLLYWFLASMVLYSFAGEKMPWLSLHISLPLILLAGKTVGALLPAIDWQRLSTKGALYLGLLILLAPLAVLALTKAGDPLAAGPDRLLRVLQGLAAASALAFLLGSIWLLARGLGAKYASQAVFLTVIVLLGVFTVRTASQASYYHGDIPVEMLVYTQTSPEVPRIRDAIDKLAAESGQGYNFPITVDADQGYTWPWAWYLRDYKNVDYPDLKATPGDPRGLVLLLNTDSAAGMQPYLNKYDPGQPYPHRWWFPEDYRTLTVSGLIADLFDPKEWLRWWSYFYNREVGAPLGASNALAYFPKGSAIQSAPPIGQPPPTGAQPQDNLPQPAVLQSDLVIGRTAGGLASPKGVAIDKDGNLYVVDSQTARISKFDPSGRLVASVGKTGAGDAEFTEPWGIAVGPDGSVYVADTWNHRVQKFTSELVFITKWGSFANVPRGGSEQTGRFFGPRAVAVDAEGSVFVTDTGNKRVQKFSPTGQFIGVFGEPGSGKGQFQEPVGIAIDGMGEILVADTWNRRIQRFTRELRYVGEFPVAGWVGQSVVNKPYLAADGEGNVFLTDPEGHRVIEYSSTGVLLKVIGRFGADASSFNLPAAVVVGPKGELFVSDAGNNRVLRFSATN